MTLDSCFFKEGCTRPKKNRKKNPSFWHLTAGFPQRVASNTKKSPKTPVFNVFWRFSLIFHFSKKRPYKAKRIVSTVFRTVSELQKRKKNQVFDTRPLFSLRGVHPTKKKSQKTLSFWHSTAGFPERGAPDQKKSQKSQKTLSFWQSTRTFPERGCTGHVFRDYWVALNWKRKEKQERERGKMMMMVRWWWEDDDDEMMMRWWWWWDDDDEMMMMRWWWLADEYHRRFFKRNPSQTLSGIKNSTKRMQWKSSRNWESAPSTFP